MVANQSLEEGALRAAERRVLGSKSLALLPDGWCGSLQNLAIEQAAANIHVAGRGSVAVFAANFSTARSTAVSIADRLGIVPRYVEALGTHDSMRATPAAIREVILHTSEQYIFLILDPDAAFTFVTAHHDFLEVPGTWDMRVLPKARGVLIDPRTLELTYF